MIHRGAKSVQVHFDKRPCRGEVGGTVHMLLHGSGLCLHRKEGR